MAKLYFKYGAMGSSKSAQALIPKFNYEERGMSVWLIKPATDNRDGVNAIRSRIGLSAEAEVIRPEDDVRVLYAQRGRKDVIIADECQFLTPAHIQQLRELVDEDNVPVLCFGLRTDFQTHLFPGPGGSLSLRTLSRRSRPSASAAPRQPSMPGSGRTGRSSRRAPR